MLPRRKQESPLPRQFFRPRGIPQAFPVGAEARQPECCLSGERSRAPAHFLFGRGSRARRCSYGWPDRLPRSGEARSKESARRRKPGPAQRHFFLETSINSVQVQSREIPLGQAMARSLSALALEFALFIFSANERFRVAPTQYRALRGGQALRVA